MKRGVFCLPYLTQRTKSDLIIGVLRQTKGWKMPRTMPANKYVKIILLLAFLFALVWFASKKVDSWMAGQTKEGVEYED